MLLQGLRRLALPQASPEQPQQATWQTPGRSMAQLRCCRRPQMLQHIKRMLHQAEATALTVVHSVLARQCNSRRRVATGLPPQALWWPPRQAGRGRTKPGQGRQAIVYGLALAS